MTYGFNKKTLEHIINVLCNNNREDLIPIVKTIFNLPKERIVRHSDMNKYEPIFFSNRVLAVIDVNDGMMWISNGKNRYICISGWIKSVVLNYIKNFPIDGADTYIMKQMINTRDNKLNEK